ncbi:hypothetical protein [Saccharopolyspora pogona]|uniref:hypothetical protein n=1 Tax=Saccharopolyspora pogona TaxID=333966 RepID=UPI001CC23EC0|nr:hypothetical protein [Saccharopolyspora pogona]
MAVGLGLVAIRRLADIPAFTDMGAQSTPGLFKCVDHLVLGDRLVDPALQDPLGAAAAETDRLVGGEQRHVRFLQLAFDGESFVGTAGDAGDAFADHHVEPASRVLRFIEQVGDAAVAGDGDIEPFVILPVAALVQFQATGLDVVEVRDDDPGFRDRSFAVTQLAQQRLARVLLILGRRAAKEGHPYLVAQQGRRGHSQRGHRVVRQARRSRSPDRHRGRDLGRTPQDRRRRRIRIHFRLLISGHYEPPSSSDFRPIRVLRLFQGTGYSRIVLRIHSKSVSSTLMKQLKNPSTATFLLTTIPSTDMVMRGFMLPLLLFRVNFQVRILGF